MDFVSQVHMVLGQIHLGLNLVPPGILLFWEEGVSKSISYTSRLDSFKKILCIFSLNPSREIKP